MNKHEEITFLPVTRENWELALELKVKQSQKAFVPSSAESLAAAYIKPWDDALDPYLIYSNTEPVGMFYLSYTLHSRDNYWIGGFFIDKRQQGKGLGRIVFPKILQFVQEMHPNCQLISLTIEKENSVARHLYESFDFAGTGRENRYGELIFEFTPSIPIFKKRS